MILMIDNYDSFTYNLVQYLNQLGAEVLGRRNDEIALAEIEILAPEAIGTVNPDRSGYTWNALIVPALKWAGVSE